MPRSLRTLVTLLALVPAAVVGAAAGGYVPVAGWPLADGAPDYGTAPVSAVSVDSRGVTYVLQRSPNPVLVFDAKGRFVRSWGKGLFTMPQGCRVDAADNVWITDKDDHRVMKFSPAGKLLLTLGVRNKPGKDHRHFNKPADLAFAKDGSIYVADGYGNSRIVHLTASGRFLGEWGKRGARRGEFNLPHSVAVDGQGRVYVADRRNERIQVFTGRGRFLAEWPRLGKPLGLWITPEQRLAVADEATQGLLIYSLNGKEMQGWGGPGHFNLPHLLCGDAAGDLYVADVKAKRALRFHPAW